MSAHNMCRHVYKGHTAEQLFLVLHFQSNCLIIKQLHSLGSSCSTLTTWAWNGQSNFFPHYNYVLYCTVSDESVDDRAPRSGGGRGAKALEAGWITNWRVRQIGTAGKIANRTRNLLLSNIDVTLDIRCEGRIGLIFILHCWLWLLLTDSNVSNHCLNTFKLN